MLSRVVAQVLRGFAMGSADLVPGVSGGTIAMVFGIYERLVHNTRMAAAVVGNVLKLNVRAALEDFRRLEWVFLLPLVAGLGTAIIALSHTIEVLLDRYPEGMSAAFFGLVASSVVLTLGDLRTRDGLRWAVLVGTAVVTFALLGLRSGEVTDPALLFVFGAGAVAICAMILPGISGSFILLMLGMYEYILGALNDRDVLTVLVFGAGTAVGITGFSSGLDWLLRTHRETVIAALIGLMLGSMRVLWPWPNGTESAALGMPTAGEAVVAVVLAVAAGAVFFGLSLLSRRGIEEEAAGEVVPAGAAAGAGER